MSNWALLATGISVLVAFGVVPPALSGADAMPQRNDSHASSHLKAVPWEVKSVKARAVIASITIDACDEREGKIQRVRVAYRHKKAIITLFIRHFPESNGCFGSELFFDKKVKLARNTRELSLYDGSAHPPVRRWPRRS